MFKIVIQNPFSETVINNVHPDELDYWKSLLRECARGDIKIIDTVSGQEFQAA